MSLLLPTLKLLILPRRISSCVAFLILYAFRTQVLAAIVIVAALSLVDPSEATFLWKSSKKEFALLVTCFVITAFVALELGIYISVALCGAEVLYKSTRPKVVRVNKQYLIVYLPGASNIGKGGTAAEQLIPEKIVGRGILIIRVEGDLNFSAASSLRNIISSQFKEAMERSKVSLLPFLRPPRLCFWS
jgi:MFS superfamily sulfate permease-like transporter